MAVTKYANADAYGIAETSTRMYCICQEGIYVAYPFGYGLSYTDFTKKCDVEYVHPIKEHSWGQRVVKIYDPDKHIIEIGENIKVVCKRFIDSGMTPEQVAERMDVQMKYTTPRYAMVSQNNVKLSHRKYILWALDDVASIIEII